MLLFGTQHAISILLLHFPSIRHCRTSLSCWRHQSSVFHPKWGKKQASKAVLYWISLVQWHVKYEAYNDSTNSTFFCTYMWFATFCTLNHTLWSFFLSTRRTLLPLLNCWITCLFIQMQQLDQGNLVNSSVMWETTVFSLACKKDPEGHLTFVVSTVFHVSG